MVTMEELGKLEVFNDLLRWCVRQSFGYGFECQLFSNLPWVCSVDALSIVIIYTITITLTLPFLFFTFKRIGTTW